MKIDIITLFPDMFKGPFDESMIKKATEKKLVEINIHNLRRWGIDKRGTVDDRPYGGGKGMILRPEPIDRALSALKLKARFSTPGSSGEKTSDAIASSSKLKATAKNSKVILLSPAGKVFNQKIAQKLAKLKLLILVCGHYEGVDYRVHKYLADEVISIGDYVLTGGEIPTMVLVDSVIRLIPGVLEKEATKYESFSNETVKQCNNVTMKLLEYPQYTRPENFCGHKVPKVLLSGNHQEIAKWRLEQAIKRTKKFRPDLLK